MWVKFVIIAAFLGIVVSLGSGLFFMSRDTGKSTRAAKAMTWRIGISVGLFGIIMLLAALGYIKPHGLTPAQPAAPTEVESNQ